ncbi:DUF302 domain-containing protein [Aurantivibrio plasticivorans]
MFSGISAYSPDDTVSRLTQAAEAAGYRVLAHIYASNNVKNIGIDTPNHQVMEIFRPDYAAKVWSYKPAAGISIPIRLHVFENDQDAVQVDCQQASETLGVHDIQALSDFANRIDEDFKTLLATVCESITTTPIHVSA